MLRFVINLHIVPDRWHPMNKRFNELGIPAERVNTVDGNLFADSIPSCYTGETVRYPRFMSASEVACFLSHRKCWERLLDSNEDWALCIEDFRPGQTVYAEYRLDSVTNKNSSVVCA